MMEASTAVVAVVPSVVVVADICAIVVESNDIATTSAATAAEAAVTIVTFEIPDRFLFAVSLLATANVAAEDTAVSASANADRKIGSSLASLLLNNELPSRPI